MKTLFAIAYPTLEEAESMRMKIGKLQREYLLELEDIVIAEKKDSGKVKLHQAVNLTTSGAVQGSFLGLLVGMLFLNPLLGVVVGAASGAVGGALTDLGIEDPMMKKMGDELQPGSSILFVLAREVNFERMLDEVEGSGGLVVKTSLKHMDAQRLQKALDEHQDHRDMTDTPTELPPEEVIIGV